MNPAKRRQLDFNVSSRDQWDAFSGHRDRVTSLLVRSGASGFLGTLCVLGAGNALDLDLPTLLAAHRRVDLVDLDAESLAAGAKRQGVADHPRLGLLGGIDVTTMLEPLASWSPSTHLGTDEITALAEGPAQLVPPALSGPYDVVASTCLLRPLVGNAFQTVGKDHPWFGALVNAIRAGHLRLLMHLLAPGGEAVLITDVVNSETLPELASLPEASLGSLLQRLDRDGNHFHGVGPSDLRSTFTKDPVLDTSTTGLRTSAPWRWRLHDRVYLVWALTFRTSPESSRRYLV